MVQQMVMVKQVWMDGGINYLKGELGEEGLAELIGELSEEERSIVQRQTLATDWVPISIINKLTRLAAAKQQVSLDDFARKFGHSAAFGTADSPYKYFVGRPTPREIFSKAPILWKIIYDRGDLLVQFPSENAAKIELTGFPAEETQCLRFTGMVEGYLMISGVSDIEVVHSSCGLDNSGSICRWETSWS